MKKGGLLLAGILFSTLLFCQEKQVSINIVQDEVVYPVAGQEIYLNKKPFQIQVTLKNLEGVYLYADFTDSIYKLKENEQIPDFDLLPPMAMAETTFNKDRELIINKDGWAFWFYDTKLDWHRFDKEVLVTPDSIVGTKTINQFYFSDGERTVPVRRIKKPLYLFFVAVDKSNKDGAPEKELIRLRIKINWE
jgi:hypothetical protein